MNGVSVRPADIADAGAIARLRQEWRSDNDEQGFVDRFRNWFVSEASRRRWWVAEDGGTRAIGMMNLVVFERMPSPGTPQARWGYLGNAFVADEHRNRGIGAALLETVVRYALGEGFVRIVLSPSPRSIPFYRRAGFRSADELMVLGLDGR